MAVLELERLHATTLGDPSFERELIRLFLDTYSAAVAHLDDEEPARARRVLHKLAGSAGSVGATSLGELAVGVMRVIDDEGGDDERRQGIAALRVEFARVSAALEARL